MFAAVQVVVGPVAAESVGAFSEFGRAVLHGQGPGAEVPSDAAAAFEGYLDEWDELGGATGDVTWATEVDGDLAVNLVGDGLGVLVGPRLATLDAIQEIVRHVLQRQAEGREYARVIVDVQGIRARRREALREYVTDAAARVRDEGVTVVFEVMSSPDRKFVHDVVNELEGVASASEGEDPRRRVVLRPA